MRYLFRAKVLCMACVAIGGVAWAQSPRRDAKEQINYPSTLAVCLPDLDWDPAKRGPLLIVAPERARCTIVHPLHFSEPMSASRSLPSRNRFRLATISPLYRRKLVTVGSLSSVVPETMATLRYKNLPEPNIWQGIPAEDRPESLLATFSPAQWRLVLSSNGIGMSDLRREQQGLFAGILPEGTTLTRRSPIGPGEDYGKVEPVSLEGIALSNLRLRLYQDLQWNFLFRGSQNGVVNMGDGDRYAPSPIYRFTFPRDEPRPQPFEYDGAPVYGKSDGVPSAFGVTLLEAQPNRVKPSDIAYDAVRWNTLVSLEGSSTVGELVARVREATGVEFYADRRYRDLPIHVRSESGYGVRAGDILKTLAYSVTATFRRVGTGSDFAFVMTDDRVGSGARFAEIGEWLRDGHAKVQAAREQLTAGARKANALTRSPWALRDDMAPSDALLRRMADTNALKLGTVKKQSEMLIPLSELPPGVLARVRAQQQEWRKREEESGSPAQRYFREDGVLLHPRVRMAVVVPNIGTVPLPSGDLNLTHGTALTSTFPELEWLMSGATPPDMSAKLPARVRTDRLVERVLAVSVNSAEDARKAVRLAHARHFSGVLFPVGDHPAAAVAEWLAAAREAVPDIALWLKAPLFRTNTTLTPEASAGAVGVDRTILGESYTASLRRPLPETTYRMPPGHDSGATGDHIAVGDADAVGAVRSRLVTLASLPTTVAGMVLTDTELPGYRGRAGDDVVPPDHELGYSPAGRLAFLREAGTDPVDLSPFGELNGADPNPGTGQRNTQVRLPFFPDPGPVAFHWKPETEPGMKDMHPRWYAFRAKQLLQAREGIRSALQKANPGIELLILKRNTGDGLAKWEASPSDMIPGTNATTKSVPVWFPVTYSERMPPGAARLTNSERFGRQAAHSFDWINAPALTATAKAKRGAMKIHLLLDLSQSPFSEAEDLLSQIVIEPSAAPTPR